MILAGFLPVVGYLDSDVFQSANLVYKLLYLWISVTVARFKYYFAWYLAEEACISSGLGFSSSSTKENPKWDALNNVNVLRTELNTNLVDVINNWNKGVNEWLKNGISN